MKEAVERKHSTVALVSHPACELHETAAGYPERPERLTAIRDALIASGVDIMLDHVEAPRATIEQVLRVHDASHLDHLASVQPTDGLVFLDPDTPIGPHSLEAALRAAGAAVCAVDLVVRGEARAAFCAVRPPGHHAERDRAMGFCLLNNVAIGAAHALEQHGFDRVAIADFDVHQGNGTETVFRGDPRVLILSAFQHPFYPFGPTGEAPNIVRVLFERGADSSVLREALQAAWIPALRAFAPQLVLISAGFDGHREDDLAETSWTEADYGWVTEELRTVADAVCAGRIVSVLEGGYALPALGRSVVAHVRALL